jgi:prepilin-type processing-associated H-X9-DG protein
MSNNSRRAFTLIELFVVMAVIIILAGLIAATYTGIQERARVVQDINNLRQIGLATQMYLNENDGVLFTSGGIWMTQLKPKYVPAWKIFQSPFDTRNASETGASAPVSYGLNGNNIIGTAIDKIVSPSVFILLAPAQTSGSTVRFQGLGGAAVTVYKATSIPDGTAATGGTHNQRKRVNALFADLHSENMLWTVFIDDTIPSPNYRWDPAGK